MNVDVVLFQLYRLATWFTFSALDDAAMMAFAAERFGRVDILVFDTTSSQIFCLSSTPGRERQETELTQKVSAI